MDDVDLHRRATLPHFRVAKVKKLDIPKQIGPYGIDSILHKGTMSILFLGTHPETKSLIAVKVLSPELISHPEMVNQFLSEAKAISLADHPNIVKVYGQGQWEKGPYIAMEFIKGLSLRQFIAGQSFSLRRSLDIILQVSYALLHLHTHGVIHRDLKPENILITESGRVKVIDFGIAQLTQEQSKGSAFVQAAGGTIGTPSYMSPEQRRDPLNVSYNTDIFSLAIVAYELITHKLSFGHIQLDLVPKHFRAILEKALNPDPKKRYQDIVDFISAISAYLKSHNFSRDRSREDQLKELWENLGEKQAKLLPRKLPNWPDMEVGFAKTDGVYLFGLYYDFFRNSDGSYLICLAESPLETVESIIPIASLRGMIHALMHQYTNAPSEIPFDLPRFVSELSQMFYHDPLQNEVSTMFLCLDPNESEFSFISSGFEALWHIPSRGGPPRHLTNRSPVLGRSPNAEFFPTTDTWTVSDTIFVHTFRPSHSGRSEVQFEENSKKLILENQGFSCSSSASRLLQQMKESIGDPIEQNQNIVLALTRY